MFYGQGAGKMPTASAVVADIMDVVRNKNSGKMYCTCYNEDKILDPGMATARFYIRLRADDKPGVLSKISGALGDNQISLWKVFQKNTVNGTAEIVMLTYDVPFRNLIIALDRVKSFQQVKEIASVIRVEEEM
jgi:homoserine dehydrogenase